MRLKATWVLLAVAIFGIMNAAATETYQTADSFQNPLENYAVTGYRFGEYLWSGLYHSGEDLHAKAYDPVYAIANGKIVWSEKDMQGYGQIIVIEHTLPDDSKIVSFYGHLSKQKYMALKGKEVAKGEAVGYIGDDAENGDGGPHLHFGIRKGADDGTWRYKGRVSLSDISNFYKPSDYLNNIRAVNTPDVYRLADLGNKVRVSSADAFNSCGWRWDDVRPVTATEISRHSNVYGMPCFPAGTFIKRANNPEISVIKEYSDASNIKNRFRQSFVTWDAFIRAGGKADLSNVWIVSETGYELHTRGKDLS